MVEGHAVRPDTRRRGEPILRVSDATGIVAATIKADVCDQGVDETLRPSVTATDRTPGTGDG
jgi:hypothetical protein